MKEFRYDVLTLHIVVIILSARGEIHVNAYELTKELNKFMTEDEYTDLDKAIFMASNMLRQQADRIAELEKQGEPVAWMEYIQDEEWEVWYTKPTDLPEGHSYKPLYLAPQTKPLSEKELYEVFDKCYPNNGDGDVVTLVDFARAIEERHGIK